MGVDGITASIEQLPTRFAGSNGFAGRFRLNIDDVSRDVVISNGSCTVEPPAPAPADVEICTDGSTWRLMSEGRMSGIEAFAARRLAMRGSIDRSLQFEPLFERPDAGGLNYRLEEVKAGRVSISTLVAGPEDGRPLLLLHGLGATKASWLTVVPGLARRYRVFAIDLPGFGASSKPVGAYAPRWFAQHTIGLLDELGYESTMVAGNSMGGRVAMEMAISHPDRVDAIACLCPAAAFSYRPAVVVARLLRPELGMLAGRLPRGRIKEGLRQLFADPKCVEDEWYDAAIDDFLKVWKSPRARLAFTRSLRNIYLDEPHGDNGFWTRLAGVDAPALCIYGRRDALITYRFAEKMSRTLPDAQVVVWNDCGHVPQIEFPVRTIQALTRFFEGSALRATAV